MHFFQYKKRSFGFMVKTFSNMYYIIANLYSNSLMQQQQQQQHLPRCLEKNDHTDTCGPNPVGLKAGGTSIPPVSVVKAP